MLTPGTVLFQWSLKVSFKFEWNGGLDEFIVPDSDMMDYPFKKNVNSKRSVIRFDSGSLFFSSDFAKYRFHFSFDEIRHDTMATLSMFIATNSRGTIRFYPDHTATDSYYDGFVVDREWMPERIQHNLYNCSFEFISKEVQDYTPIDDSFGSGAGTTPFVDIVDGYLYNYIGGKYLYWVGYYNNNMYFNLDIDIEENKGDPGTLVLNSIEMDNKSYTTGSFLAIRVEEGSNLFIYGSQRIHPPPAPDYEPYNYTGSSVLVFRSGQYSYNYNATKRIYSITGTGQFYNIYPTESLGSLVWGGAGGRGTLKMYDNSYISPVGTFLVRSSIIPNSNVNKNVFNGTLYRDFFDGTAYYGGVFSGEADFTGGTFYGSGGMIGTYIGPDGTMADGTYYTGSGGTYHWYGSYYGETEVVVGRDEEYLATITNSTIKHYFWEGAKAVPLYRKNSIQSAYDPVEDHGTVVGRLYPVLRAEVSYFGRTDGTSYGRVEYFPLGGAQPIMSLWGYATTGDSSFYNHPDWDVYRNIEMRNRNPLRILFNYGSYNGQDNELSVIGFRRIGTISQSVGAIVDNFTGYYRAGFDFLYQKGAARYTRESVFEIPNIPSYTIVGTLT